MKEDSPAGPSMDEDGQSNEAEKKIDQDFNSQCLEEITSFKGAFNSIKILLGSVAIFALGCLLVFAPDLRNNPRRISAVELFLGIATMGAGAAMC